MGILILIILVIVVIVVLGSAGGILEVISAIFGWMIQSAFKFVMTVIFVLFMLGAILTNLPKHTATTTTDTTQQSK